MQKQKFELKAVQSPFPTRITHIHPETDHFLPYTQVLKRVNPCVNLFHGNHHPFGAMMARKTAHKIHEKYDNRKHD